MRVGPVPVKGVLTVISVFVGAVAGGAMLSGQFLSPRDAVEEEDLGMRELRDGPELAFIYIGRSSCAWCRRPETQEAIREAIDSLRQTAARRGWSFATRGISLDRDVRTGTEHLEEVAEFDEVASGGGWLSEGGRSLIWESPSASPATPTVVVVALMRERGAADGQPVLQVLAERELFRATGLVELRAWKASGFRTRAPEQVLLSAAKQLRLGGR